LQATKIAKDIMRTFLVSLDMTAPLLALIAGLFLLKNFLFKSSSGWLVWYLLSCLLFNAAANIISEMYEVNNHILYHIENQLNFIFLSIYFCSLPLLAKFKRFIISTTILFTIVNISYKIIAANYDVFDSPGFALSSIFFSIYCLCYYAALLQAQKGEDLFAMPAFWFVTGILVYYACCFFIFILYRFYTMQGNSNIGILWYFQNVMLAIMSIFIAKGFVCQASYKSPILL
jgi:hypothetical protein